MRTAIIHFAIGALITYALMMAHAQPALHIDACNNTIVIVK